MNKLYQVVIKSFKCNPIATGVVITVYPLLILLAVIRLFLLTLMVISKKAFEVFDSFMKLIGRQLYKLDRFNKRV